MKGLKVWQGKNKDCCSFQLFLATERERAENCKKVMEAQFKNLNFMSGIEEIEVNQCRCGKLTFADMTECFRCEEARYDAWLEHKEADREEEAEIEAE